MLCFTLIVVDITGMGKPINAFMAPQSTSSPGLARKRAM